MQAAHLRRLYPDSKVVLCPNLLTWVGELRPTELSPKYEVLVAMSVGADPLVYVVSPQLRRRDGAPIEHVYDLNTLCLYLGEGEWEPADVLAETVVPWAAEWLFFHEAWLATGKWLGGGVHPQRSIGRRTANRASGAARSRKETRLHAALQQAYGRDADFTTLLGNSTV